MNQKTVQIAQKLINLYRQAHVIIGGWAAVNEVFISESNDDVLAEMRTLPTGTMLARHIENLHSGKTPMDSIERELMPYGGMMTPAEITSPLTKDEMIQLENTLNTFTPDETGLNILLQNPVITKFNDEWIPAIRSALRTHPDMLEKWNTVVQTYRAYNIWKTATELLNRTLSDRERAKIQADIPEYETYLPMFGDAGDELLAKLRKFISSREPAENII